MNRLFAGRRTRIAGWLYLIVVVTGVFSLAYVPGQVFVSGDAHATATNIAAREALFRWGIFGFVLEQFAFLALALELHRVLRATSNAAATLMLILVAISVPFALVCCTHLLDALSWATGAGNAQGFDRGQTDAMVAQAIDGYRHGMALVGAFWGLWLLPLAWLVAKSRLLPRILAWLLAAGGVGYLVDTGCKLLWPEYRASALADYATLPAALGEIGTCLWMLVFGIRRPVD